MENMEKNPEYIFATKMIDKLSVYEFLTECSDEELKMLNKFAEEVKNNRRDDEESGN
jgi:hypothetical protein